MIEVTIPLLFVYILDKSEFLVVMSTLLYSWCELLIRSFLLIILKLMKVELDEAGDVKFVIYVKNYLYQRPESILDGSTSWV